MVRSSADQPPRQPDPPRPAPTLEQLDISAGIDHDDHFGAVAIAGAAPDATMARGVMIEESRGEQLDLSGVRMPGLSMVDMELRGGSLANADLRTASWRRVALVRVRLTGTRWSEANLEDVRFDGCQIDLAAFTGCGLRRVAFHECRLSGSDMQELSAQDVSFVDCDLSEVDLTGARFARTEMRGCTLDGIRSLERLRGVGMRWEDVLSSAGAFAGAIGIRLVEG